MNALLRLLLLAAAKRKGGGDPPPVGHGAITFDAMTVSASGVVSGGAAAVTFDAMTVVGVGSVGGSARMTISGQTLFDRFGQPFIPRGNVVGHGELERAGDAVTDLSMGANVRRIGIRWWTDDTSGFQTDAESDSDPGHIAPAYWARISAEIDEAHDLGLMVHVFFDSNCGQGVGTGAVCKLDGTNVVDFASNTTESNAKRAKNLEMIAWVVGQKVGKIDSMEGLVEPSGNFTQSTYWDFAEDVMDAVQPIDPSMIFFWGGHPNYQAVDIGDSLRPGWTDVGSPYRDRLVATCNILTNLATNPTQRVDRVENYIVPARTALNVPVVIQQVGTRTDGDSTDEHLEATLTLLDQNNIGYTVWERRSVFGTSYGWTYLSDTNDANSALIEKTRRKNILKAHFSGAPYWMTAPTIVGTPTQGSLVSYTSGQVSGRPVPTITARVLVGGVDRGDASTYIIQAGDVGFPVVIRQTATNTNGVASSNSAAVNAVGSGAATVLELRMLGGQIDTPLDYSGLTMYQDLAKSIRNFAIDADGFRYQEATTLLKVSSLTRASNVVSVVLSAAPGSYASGQDIATGMRLVLTCLQDPTFDADHAVITVTDQTHFTYPNTGANGSYTAVSEYDVPATVINSVSVGSDGQPTQDFCGVLSTVSGSATSKPDLNGVYSGFFPGTPPSGLTFDGAALSNYTAGGTTFTLTVDSTDSAFIAMHCTGVVSGFEMPRIIRTDHDTSGNTLLRPDFVEFQGRFLRVLRIMDGGRTNSNAFVKSWAKRPVVSCGMGMTLEDAVRACNQLGCDLWYCIPHWADSNYITQAATYIKNNLVLSLNALFEYVNEEWNDNTFPHLAWCMTRLRKLLKGHFHGVKGESVIASVTKSSGVVTVDMNRPPPFANGATAVFAILTGTTTGYNTPDTGAVMTVSGNSFSFAGNSGSGTATATVATIIGDPSQAIYSWDKTKTYRELATRMHGQRTYEIGQLVSAVFGGLNGRGRMLLMNWFANTVQFGLLEDMALKYLEAQYGSTKAWLWGIGGAPYPESEAGNTTSAQVMASLRSGPAGLDTYDLQYHRSSYLASRYAHEHIQYEGGPDLNALGGNTALVDAVYADPDYRMFNAELVRRSLAAGVDVYVPFYTSMAFTGTPGGQTWGIARTLAADKTIGGASTTRVRGIDDVLLAAPPAYTDPNKLPGTLYFVGGSGYIDDTTGTGANNGMRQLFSQTAQCEDLFFVDPADNGNTINITVYGGCKVGGGANGVRIYLDDVLMGTLNLPTTSSLASMPSGGSASAQFPLPSVSAGKHRLKIMSPTPQPDEVGVSRVDGV